MRRGGGYSHMNRTKLFVLATLAGCATDSTELGTDESALIFYQPPPSLPPQIHFLSIQNADGIDTPLPIENRPMHVKYELDNFFSSQTVTGTVYARISPTNGAPYWSDTWGSITVQPWQSVTGVLTFNAPTANNADISSHVIDLVFFQWSRTATNSTYGGYVQVMGDEMTFDSGARYWIGMDAFHPDITRAPQQDTDYITVSGQQSGNKPYAHPNPDQNNTLNLLYAQTHKLGEWCCNSQSTYHPGMYFFADSLMKQNQPPVQFVYSIVNAGYSGADAENFLDWVSHIAAAVTSFVYPDYAPLLIVIDQAVNKLLTYAFANCDGVVALEQLSLTPALLYNTITPESSWFQRDDATPGTASPQGCGKTSLYHVWWSATRYLIGNDASTITPAHSTLSANQTVQLTFNWPDPYTGTPKANFKTTWAVVGGPSNGWIDDTGLYHAPAQVTVGGNAAPGAFVTVVGTVQQADGTVEWDQTMATPHTVEAYISLLP
jgi:hypothetical protein